MASRICRSPLVHLGLLAACSWLIAWVFPMYFRLDDFQNLAWSAHHHLLDAFQVKTAMSYGAFRPMYNLYNIVLFRLFGLDPFGFQVVGNFVFLSAFYLFFVFARSYFGRSTAVVALILYGVLFYNHFQMAFWFADITFTLHLCFTLLSLIFHLKGKGDPRFAVVSYLFALLGLLTKEPSIVIVSSFVFADLLLDARLGRPGRRILLFLPYGVLALLMLSLSPAMGSRFGQAGGAAHALGYRFGYYFHFLATGTKALIPVLLAFLLVLAAPPSLGRGRWLGPVLALPCYVFPFYYIAFMMLGLAAMALLHRKLFPVLLWVLLTSLTLPLMPYITPSYLFEFSFGFSLALGFLLATLGGEWAGRAGALLRPRPWACAGILVLVAVPAARMGLSQIRALRLVVESRRNAAEGIEYLVAHPGQFRTLVVPDDDGVDQLGMEGVAARALQSNVEKSRNAKTVTWEDLKVVLALRGRGDQEVLPFSAYVRRGSPDPTDGLFLQNDHEIQTFRDSGRLGPTLFAFSLYGTNGLRIGRIRPVEGGASGAPGHE